MYRRGNGRRGARRGGYGRNFMTKRNFITQTRGKKLNPRADPPSVIVRPWKSQILVFFGTGSKTFTDSTITAGIATQNAIAIATGTTFSVRLQRVYLWQEIPLNSTTNVPQPLRSPISLKIHSIVGENDETVISDYGTSIRYAKCGYLWPSSQRITPLVTAGPDKILTVSPTDTDQTWILHVHVLWTTFDTTEDTDSGEVENIIDRMQRLKLSQNHDNINLLPSTSKLLVTKR